MRLTHVQTTSDLHAQLKRKLVVMLLTYIFSGFNICFLDSRFSRDYLWSHIHIFSCSYVFVWTCCIYNSFSCGFVYTGIEHQSLSLVIYLFGKGSTRSL